jgi:Killing trait
LLRLVAARDEIIVAQNNPRRRSQMADPTLVNGQITDAVTQSNVTVLGNAAANAMATIYQVMAHSVGLSMQNAVANQQRMNALSSGVTTQGVNLLYTQPTAADTRSTQVMLSGNELTSVLAALKTVMQVLGKT